MVQMGYRRGLRVDRRVTTCHTWQIVSFPPYVKDDKKLAMLFCTPYTFCQRDFIVSRCVRNAGVRSHILCLSRYVCIQVCGTTVHLFIIMLPYTTSLEDSLDWPPTI